MKLYSIQYQQVHNPQAKRFSMHNWSINFIKMDMCQQQAQILKLQQQIGRTEITNCIVGRLRVKTDSKLFAHLTTGNLIFLLFFMMLPMPNLSRRSLTTSIIFRSLVQKIQLWQQLAIRSTSQSRGRYPLKRGGISHNRFMLFSFKSAVKTKFRSSSVTLKLQNFT